MKKPIKWDIYIELVHFIGECMGDNTEVVLHDLTNLEHSVIAIHNGHLTGRTVGAPLTILALNKLKNLAHERQSKIVNYRGTAPNGNPFRSSSFFIYNEKGEATGVLCVNVDVSEYKKAEGILKKLAFIPEPSSEKTNNHELAEKFPNSISEMVFDTLTEVLEDDSIQISRLMASEKMKIIEKLNQKGLFQIKGAISDVAEQMATSEATIYRYLSKINRNSKK